ncbi:MAG: Zn-ribbon domain-containing OB-fold protein [Dehalococcoidia bacterium]
MTEKADEELLILPITYDVPYRWSAGEHVGRFLEELRDNARIYCNLCPKCGRAQVPPRPVCDRCHVRRGEWVELGHKGTVLTFVVVQQSFWDPTYGIMRPVPYTIGTIQLDGPPSSFTHLLEETDPEKLRIGMRVQAVFKPKEERRGHISDILHFKTIEE